jgi:hypothetical protein
VGTLCFNPTIRPATSAITSFRLELKLPKERVPVVLRVDHGLGHVSTAAAPARYELHFKNGVVIYSNALPDASVFILQDSQHDPV